MAAGRDRDVHAASVDPPGLLPGSASDQRSADLLAQDRPPRAASARQTCMAIAQLGPHALHPDGAERSGTERACARAADLGPARAQHLASVGGGEEPGIPAL